MVRYINCIKRSEGISLVEFAMFWRDDQFTRLVERTAELYKAERWTKNLTLKIEANVKALELPDNNPPYDGVIEYYWNSGGDLMRILESAEGAELFKEMSGYQSDFIDLENSPQFFTEA